MSVKCQYCGKEIYAMTWLQELQKHNAHLNHCRKNPDLHPVDMKDALEKCVQAEDAQAEGIRKFRYVVYREDGRKQSVESDGKTLGLEILQKLVGGNIELFRGRIGPDKDRLFIVDEEGLLKGRRINPFLKQFVGTVVVTSLDGVE